MKVETVEDWLVSFGPLGEALVADGGGLSYFTPDILEARVIRTCPSCGGSRKCPQCEGGGKWFYELELKMIDCDKCGGTGACPDCKDSPTYVIAPEAYSKANVEAVTVAVAAMSKEDPPKTINDYHALVQRLLAAIPAMRDVILQALLPGARVAKEVGVIRNLGDRGAARELAMETTGGRCVTLITGSPIAILEDSQGGGDE